MGTRGMLRGGVLAAAVGVAGAAGYAARVSAASPPWPPQGTVLKPDPSGGDTIGITAPPRRPGTSVGLHFSSPAGWRKEEQGGRTVFLGPRHGQFNTNLAVSIGRSPVRAFPAGFLTVLERHVGQSVPGYKITASQEFPVEGGCGLLFDAEFRNPSSGEAVKQRQAILLRGPWVYNFTFGCAADSFDREVGRFATVLQSIRWR